MTEKGPFQRGFNLRGCLEAICQHLSSHDGICSSGNLLKGGQHLETKSLGNLITSVDILGLTVTQEGSP